MENARPQPDLTIVQEAHVENARPQLDLTILQEAHVENEIGDGTSMVQYKSLALFLGVKTTLEGPEEDPLRFAASFSARVIFRLARGCDGAERAKCAGVWRS